MNKGTEKMENFVAIWSNLEKIFADSVKTNKSKGHKKPTIWFI